MEILNSIKEKMAHASKEAGRTEVPTLIAVSKFQPIDKILDLYSQGQRVFGENYVQELIGKSQELKNRGVQDIEFHFIGKLQTNKVKSLLPSVAAIHSIDSIRLLNEVEKRAKELGLRPGVYFQINIDKEESKGGFKVEEIPELIQVARSLQFAKPVGLMAIPDPDQNPDEAFKQMHELSLQHRDTLGSGLSMGMSGDFEKAIKWGSTSIRVGTALFGQRPS
jgi:pyridoxal phosphate enzyme (YggS family)